jgi:hypothetical protein
MWDLHRASHIGAPYNARSSMRMYCEVSSFNTK